MDVFFLFAPTFFKTFIIKHTISARWSTNLNRGRSHLPHRFQLISYSSPKCRFSCALNTSAPLVMLIVEPQMVNMFWASTLISNKHVFFLVPVLRSMFDHILLEYRCIQIVVVFNLGTFTLPFWYPFIITTFVIYPQNMCTRTPLNGLGVMSGY